MKTNFLPQLQLMPGGVGGLGGAIGNAAGGVGAALGGTPIGAIVQGVGGLAQSIIGGIQANKAQKKLEKMVEGYQPNRGIMDYYNKALQRYNLNPYQSATYKNATQQAGRGLATGINALQDRRSALAGVGNLVQGYNDASLRAAATAENQQAQALSQLGGATQMKAQEEKYPFELKYNLLAAKAAGGNQIMNAGLSNAYGSANSLSQRSLLKNQYGG